eukprot:GGOE01013854.1.p1 GENE.GGOE01013854.1~~GGOE01013854.1.p1  ORF type:complete len:118 (+),score=2.23 GGOE01013854.1:57-410(+)
MPRNVSGKSHGTGSLWIVVLIEIHLAIWEKNSATASSCQFMQSAPQRSSNQWYTHLLQLQTLLNWCWLLLRISIFIQIQSQHLCTPFFSCNINGNALVTPLLLPLLIIYNVDNAAHQ